MLMIDTSNQFTAAPRHMIATLTHSWFVKARILMDTMKLVKELVKERKMNL